MLSRLFATAFLAVALLASQAFAQTCPNLRGLAVWSVLTASGSIGNTGTSTFTGRFGSLSSSNTGLQPSMVTGGGGNIYVGSTTTLDGAINDANTLWDSYTTVGGSAVPQWQDLGTTYTFGSQTLAQGHYRVNGNAQILGTFTLVQGGTYVFYITGTLTSAANSIVTMNSGTSTNPCCVLWLVAGATTTGANSILIGTLMSRTGAITLGANSQTNTIIATSTVSAQIVTINTSILTAYTTCGVSTVTTYGYVWSSFNTCAGGTCSGSSCTSQTTGQFYCGVSVNSVWSTASTETLCGSNLFVVCLSGSTSVSCNTFNGGSFLPTTTVSSLAVLRTTSFTCTYTQVATTTYAYLFAGFSTCTGGTCSGSLGSSTTSGSFSCGASTSSGFWTSASSESLCGNNLSVVCLSGNTAVSCTSFSGGNTLPSTSFSLATLRSASYACTYTCSVATTYAYLFAGFSTCTGGTCSGSLGSSTTSASFSCGASTTSGFWQSASSESLCGNNLSVVCLSGNTAVSCTSFSGGNTLPSTSFSLATLRSQSYACTYTCATTTYAYLFAGFSTCTGGTCSGTLGSSTTSGSFSCGASTTSGFWQSASSESLCGNNLSVVCLSGNTAVSCTSFSGGNTLPTSSFSLATLRSASYACTYTCQVTVSYAWYFISFPSSCGSGICGTTSTQQASFGCATQTGAGAVWQVGSSTQTCANQAGGSSLPIYCFSGSSSVGSSCAGLVTGASSWPSSATFAALSTSTFSQSCSNAACVNLNPGSWCVQAWSTCSQSCSGTVNGSPVTGLQTRIVSCTNQDSGDNVAFSLCDQNSRPVSQQACNTQPCQAYTWMTTAWTTCSPICRGTRTRTVTCVLVSDYSAAPSENNCAGMTRPSTTRTCNADDASCVSYIWVARPYTQCFPTCGTSSKRTRAFDCYGTTNPSYQTITNYDPSTDSVYAFVAQSTSLCPSTSGLVSQESCSVGACVNTPTYNWSIDVFGQCSATCGGGIRTRTVLCYSSNSNVPVNPSLCVAAQGAKSPTSEICGTVTCQSYHWVATAYGTCSTSCGYGTRSRSALCYAGPSIVAGVPSQDVTGGPVDNSFCAGLAALPLQTVGCNLGLCAPQYNWYASGWGACSATCGGGSQTRTLTCWSNQADTREPVRDSLCPTTRPITQQNCMTQPCVQYVWSEPEFQQCSCATMSQSRTPVCYARTNGVTNFAQTFPDSACTDQTDPANPNGPCPWALAKPHTIQACVPTSTCQNYYWWSDSWSICMSANPQSTSTDYVACGTGRQTRAVQCWSYDDETAAVDDQLCLSNILGGANSRPASTKSCNTQSCVAYAWVASPYCECSRVCGGGTQRSSLQCYQQDGTGGNGVAVSDNNCQNLAVPIGYSLQLGGGYQSVQNCNPQSCASFQWVLGTFSECNKLCGCGRMTRTVYCQSTLNPGFAVADDKCVLSGLGPKALTYQACNTNPCPVKYYWAVTPYNNCSASCASNVNGLVSVPTQTRTATCYWTDLPDLTCQINRWAVPAADVAALCPSPQPRLSRSCNLTPCVSYSWYTSAWSKCTKDCDTGMRYRTVQCYASNDNKNFVSEAMCTGQKPISQQTCNVTPCVSYLWITSVWSTCSTTCGGGTMTRTARCYSWADKATPVSDSFCNDQTYNLLTGVHATEPKPALSMTCNTCACPSTYSWYYEQWSQCSVNCGGGTSTRGAFCYGSNNANSAVADSFCTSTLGLVKLATSQVCNQQACEVYRWAVGEWSSCETCGVTSQTRTVRCFKQSDDQNAVDNVFCSGQSVPSSSQACTTFSQCATCSWQYQPGTGFGICSKSCNGVQSRLVQCYCSNDPSTPAAASQCLNANTLSTTQSCNVNVPSCFETYEWVNILGVCSAVNNCGTGVRANTVYCRSTTDLFPVPDSFCPQGQKSLFPAITSCSLNACPVYEWKQLGFGPCPVTCGTSTQVQRVGCYLSTDISGFTPYPESYCNPSLKPVTTQACTGIQGAVCSINSLYTWYSGAGGCSQSCGGGSRYYVVYCRAANSLIAVADSNCVAADKPRTVEACNVQACPAQTCLATRNNVASCWSIAYSSSRSAQISGLESTACNFNSFLTNTATSGIYNWFTGPFGSCNGSQRTRTVGCRINNAVTFSSYIVNDALCTTTKPTTTTTC